MTCQHFRYKNSYISISPSLPKTNLIKEVKMLMILNMTLMEMLRLIYSLRDMIESLIIHMDQEPELTLGEREFLEGKPYEENY